MSKKVYAVILAGGIGTRLNHGSPKQFLRIGDRSVLEHSIEAYQNSPGIDEIILVSNKDNKEDTERIVRERNYVKVKKILTGGTTRQKSSYNALQAIEDNSSYVLIHDAARPFVSGDIIKSCIKGLEEHDAVVPVCEIPDTIGEIDSSGNIINIPRRQFIRKIQTPQAFKTPIIKTAHEMFINADDIEATDDCMLVLRFRLAEVHTVPGSEDNIKITRPGDLDIAERIYELSKKVD